MSGLSLFRVWARIWVASGFVLNLFVVLYLVFIWFVFISYSIVYDILHIFCIFKNIVFSDLIITKICVNIFLFLLR